jgi:hypothetical protein
MANFIVAVLGLGLFVLSVGLLRRTFRSIRQGEIPGPFFYVARREVHPRRFWAIVVTTLIGFGYIAVEGLAFLWLSLFR